MINPLDVPVDHDSDVIPLHEVRDHDKLAALVESMSTDGWVGSPVVVHAGRAYTGSHRIAAAARAGVAVPAVDLADLVAACGADLNELVEDYHPQPLRDETGCDTRVYEVVREVLPTMMPAEVLDAYGIDIQ